MKIRWRRMFDWFRSLQSERPVAREGGPPPAYLLHPYSKPVPIQDYYAAWSEVRLLPAGAIIIAMLHERLASVLGEKCPLTLHTAEERSIWMANHDGRLQILELLAREAYLNTRLSGALPTEQKLKGPSG